MANFKPDQNEYKNLTPFKMWLVNQINTWGCSNFPFLESDFDKLTNYAMMMKLMKAMNNVIANENKVEEDMTNLFNAFTELQNYINNYFDNLDVQEEINNKLDAMAESGELTNLIKNYVDPIYQAYEQEINGIISNQNLNITAISNKVDAVASGSPLVASSTSEMTDTTRVYVNTTDGYWYYYNGTAWQRGGLYQSTGISENTVNESMVTFHKRTNNLFNNFNPSIIHMIYSTSSLKMVENANSTTIVIPVSPSTKYAIKKDVGTRFNVWGTETYPDVDVDVLNPLRDFNASSPQHAIYETTSDTHYLCFWCYNSGAEPLINVNTLLATVMINEGDSYIPYEQYYDINVLNKDLKDNDIDLDKLSVLPLTLNSSFNIKKTSQLVNPDINKIVHLIPSTAESPILIENLASYTLVLRCKHSTQYAIQKLGGGSRFCIWQTDTYPTLYNDVKNMYSTPYITDPSINKYVYTTNEDSDYLCLFFFNSNADTGKTFDEMIKSIMINEGSEYDKLTSYYNITANLENIYVDLSMFKNIGFVGDSYTQGAIYMRNQWFDGKSLGLSYPDCIAKRRGINILNCGVGGTTTRSWQTSPNGLARILSEDAQDLYYLGLGINDANQLGLDYLGTISDINDEDYTQNEDTFYGNYGKIIEQIKQHAPYAKFIMVGCMRPDSMNSNYGVFTNAIKTIAEHYSFPFINPYDDSYFNSPVMTTLSNNHPTPAGYDGISRAIERLTSNIINENPEYFIDSNYGSLI